MMNYFKKQTTIEVVRDLAVFFMVFGLMFLFVYLTT